jgi:hypothetical protein
MCVIILVLCLFVIILFCKYLSLKNLIKKKFIVHSAFERILYIRTYPVRSNVDMGLRTNSLACV